MYIKVHVLTETKVSSIAKQNDDTYRVSVTSPRKNGWANEEVRDILVSHFGTRNIRIAAGHTSSHKIFSIEKENT